MATYYDLYISCPACLGKKPPVIQPPAYWTHANDCGARIQIGDDAYLKCKNGHSSHIRNWKYACDEHATDYRPCSAASFAHAISIAGQLANIGGILWFRSIIDNMGTDW